MSEDLSKIEDSSEIEEDFTWFSRGPETRLFWNLEHYPIPISADLDSIHPNIELALHRMGFHGWLEIRAYGNKLNHAESDLYKARIIHKPPKGDQKSTVGQMSLDLLFFASAWLPDKPPLVVIAKLNPESELHRVLQCLQSRGHSVLIVEPPEDTAQDGLFQSADSVVDCTQFLGGGKPRLRSSASDTDTDTDNDEDASSS